MNFIKTQIKEIILLVIKKSTQLPKPVRSIDYGIKELLNCYKFFEKIIIKIFNETNCCFDML